MKNLKGITRREFLKVMGLFAGSVSVGSTFSLVGCGYPTAETLDTDGYLLDGDKIIVIPEQVPQLLDVGCSATITNNYERVYLIIARTGDEDFTVALNQCPHREKRHGYDHDTGLFICASGKSKFKLDGSIVEGPAKYPLPMYKCWYTNGRLEIDLLSVQI